MTAERHAMMAHDSVANKAGGAENVMMVKTSKPKDSDGKEGVVSLKITLQGAKPPIWRRLLVRGEMTLGELHRALQAVMGWNDCHLHVFDIDGTEYGDPESVDDVANEKRMTVNGVMKTGVQRFKYTYDFGDDWEHVVLIEKRLPKVEVKSYPACVAGARACPPEDCGGRWGYEQLLEALADPAHPEHDERVEWVGGDFDAEAFSVEASDARLASSFERK